MSSLLSKDETLRSTEVSSTVGGTSLTTNLQAEEHDRKSAVAAGRLKLAILIFFGLTAAGVLTAFCVYRSYNRRAQQNAFVNRFAEDADNMLASLGMSIDSTLGATDAFAVSMLAYAKATNQTYPFVTIGDFAVQAGKLLKNSGAKYITTYQVVEESERKEWESYTSQNNGWIEESIEIQSRDRSYSGPNITDQYIEEKYTGHYDLIHGYDEHIFGWEDNTGGVSHEGPYLPIWQCTPVIPVYPVYNWYVFYAMLLTLHLVLSVLPMCRTTRTYFWSHPLHFAPVHSSTFAPLLSTSNKQTGIFRRPHLHLHGVLFWIRIWSPSLSRT